MLWKLLEKSIPSSTWGKGEFIRNKIAGKTVKAKPDIDENFWNVEDIIIPLEKGEGILDGLRKIL